MIYINMYTSNILALKKNERYRYINSRVGTYSIVVLNLGIGQISKYYLIVIMLLLTLLP